MSLAPATPIVVFGDDWGRHVSTMQHLFRWIMPRHPVVWVNAIGHRKPRVGLADARRALEKVRAMTRPPVATEPGWDPGGAAPRVIVQPRVLPWHDRPAVYALNVRSMVRAIRRALAAADLKAPPILVTGSPPSVGVIGQLGELCSAYVCMDDFLHLPGVSADMLGPLEARLLLEVDVVIATARYLTETKVPGTGRVHYLPQGVNYEHFATPQPEPAELHGLPRPRIGFAGGLSANCDLELIRRSAEAFPGGSVILVGSVTTDLGPLAGCRNIHVLGPRSYAALPAYVQAFDVGIIPYVLNEHIRAVDPLKLLEYLAAGLPVVSTLIPEVTKYGEAIWIGDGAEAFVQSLVTALAADRAEVCARGQALAAQHSWERRADELLGILADTVERRATAAAAGRLS